MGCPEQWLQADQPALTMDMAVATKVQLPNLSRKGKQDLAGARAGEVWS